MKRIFLFLLLLYLNTFVLGSSQKQCKMPIVPYKINNNFMENSCTYDYSCKRDYYCFRPIMKETGRCIPCWACCGFDKISNGFCPMKCNCNDYCENHYTCGISRFCDRTTGLCKKCSECTGIQCNSCLNNSTITEEESFYQYYTLYDIKKIILDSSSFKNAHEIKINSTEIDIWIKTQHVNDDKINITKSFLMNYTNRTSLDIVSTNLQYLQNSFSTICNFSLFGNSSFINSTHHDNINGTYEGCYCSASIKCNAGLRCSKQAYNGFTSDIYNEPNGTISESICIPCQYGEFCDIGTYLRQETPDTIKMLQCPVGYYCPTPKEKYKCRNGTFCPTGTINEYSCDMNRLLQTTLTIPAEDKFVLELLLNNEPYKGNYCPENATSPTIKCESGWYCPNSAIKYQCPYGSYCKAQSLFPTKCPILTYCPVGSSVPVINGIPFLFLGIFVLIILLPRILYNVLYTVAIRCTKQNRHNLKEIVTSPIPSLPKSSSYYDFQPFVNDIHDNLNHNNLNLTNTVNNNFINNNFIIPLEKIELFNVSARTAFDKDPWLCPNSVRYYPTKLNAIIGGSGCGKSTFLDLLRGNIPSGCITGYVKIKLQNQKTLKLNLENMEKLEEWYTFEKMKQFRGYVPQDDILFAELTVQENILYSVLLKKTINKKQAIEYTLFTVNKLGLDTIKDKIVGNVEKRGISGGQRKRVNIAMEIAHMPSLLIMDEPTSGLDATGSQNLIEFCKELAHSLNITIISVIHQPRYTSFILFDNIILLSKYGTIYEGSPATALIYFNKGLDTYIDKNENPADVLMDIISGKRDFKQEFLVNTWRTKGTQWVKDCHQKYPLLPIILDKSIAFDQSTRNIFTKLIEKLEVLTSLDIKNIFEILHINIDIDRCQEFININGMNNYLYPKQLLKIFHEKCSEAFCKNLYGNVIEKISLFENTSKHIHHKYSETELTRHIILAYRFIRRLMKRIGKEHKNIFLKNSSNLDNEILLASMTCKGIDDYYTFKNTFLLSSIEKKHNPSFFTHVFIIFLRKCLMIWRSAWTIQLIIPIIAAFIVGYIQGSDYTIETYPNNIVYAMVTLGVLSMITHIRTFTMDKVVIRREIESKITLFPYFIAYNISDLIWIILIPFVFTFPYYYLIYPATSYFKFYTISLALCWWTSGASYIISSFSIGMQWANLICVFVAIIFGAFLQGLNPTIASSKDTMQGFIINLSYNRWAMEAYIINEFSFFDSVQPNSLWLTMNKIGLCGLSNDYTDTYSVNRILDAYNMMKINIYDNCKEYILYAYLWLFGYGCIFRIIALVIMYCNTHPIILRFMWKIKHIFSYSIPKCIGL